MAQGKKKRKCINCGVVIKKKNPKAKRCNSNCVLGIKSTFTGKYLW